jgi:hypothetical protein
MRKRRSLYVLGLAVALTMVAGAIPAFARTSHPAALINWSEGAPFPQGATRFDGQYISNNKRVYFLGFRLADNSTDGSIWYYNTVNQTYTDTGVDMPIPISNYQIAALNDAHGLGLYTFGGRDNNGDIIKAVQVYYPSDNTTRLLNQDSWPGKTPSGCVSLPANAAVVHNHAFIVGGMSFSTSVPPCIDDQSAQTWIFNPKANAGQKWSPGPPLNVARGYITLAVLNGKIYAIGGDTNSAGTLFANNAVEAYQPPSGTWDDAGVADLPTSGGCDESQAFALTQGSLAPSIVLAGCGQWPNAQAFTQVYKATTNSWANAGVLNEARRNQAGAMFGSTLFVVGGYDATGATTLASSEMASATLHGGTKVVHGSVGAASGAGKAVTN